MDDRQTDRITTPKTALSIARAVKTKGGNDHFNRKNSTKTRIDYVIVWTNSQTDKQTDKQTNRHR